MNHKNNKRSEATKNKIKQALVEMLKEQDISKITVMALCEQAEINRSTFYNHYSSPKSTLRGMQKEFLHMVTTYIQGTLDNTPAPAPETITQLMCEINCFIKDNLGICKVLSDVRLCPDFPTTLYNNPTIRQFLSLCLKGDYAENEIDFIYQFLFRGVFHTLELWMEKDCETSPEEVAALIDRIISKF